MEDKIVQIIERLENVAPAAWDAMLAHAQLSAALELAVSLAYLVFIAAMARRLPTLWARAYDNDLEPVAIIGGTVVGILGVLAIGTLASASTWLGLFYPEAAVIHELLSAATK